VSDKSGTRDDLEQLGCVQQEQEWAENRALLLTLPAVVCPILTSSNCTFRIPLPLFCRVDVVKFSADVPMHADEVISQRGTDCTVKSKGHWRCLF